MKHFLLAALLCCVALLSIRADVVIPRPSQLTVSNLSAFPKVKFTIVTSEQAPQPLQENKTYDLRAPAQLYVEDVDHKPHLWLTVEYHGFNSQALKVHIKEVRSVGKELEVRYDAEKTALPPPQRDPPHRSSSMEALSPFLLASLGLCGLVIIAPRNLRKRG